MRRPKMTGPTSFALMMISRSPLLLSTNNTHIPIIENRFCQSVTSRPDPATNVGATASLRGSSANLSSELHRSELGRAQLQLPTRSIRSLLPKRVLRLLTCHACGSKITPPKGSKTDRR